MPTPGNSPFDSRLLRLAAFALLLALTATALGLVRPTSLPLHHDTSRDLHGALTALATEQGPLVGPPTSAAGIMQGGFWTVHLAMVLGLGGDMALVATLTFALVVLSVLALAMAGTTLWEWEIGFAAALVAACVLVAARTTWVVQWNPSLLPLPAALTLLFLLEGIRYQRVLPLALGAATLGLTLQLHPASWLLLPLATWTTWRHIGRCRTGPGRDRVLCWLLLSTLALLPFALFGAEALYQTLREAGQAGASMDGEGHHPTAWWCGAALAAAAFHGFATFFRPAYARALHNTVAIWAALPAAFFLLFFLWRGVQPAPRHLLPYLPAAALVMGALPANLRRIHPLFVSWNWLRGIAPVAALGGLLALVTASHPAGVTYTYEEAQWIAEELRTDGICEPDIVAASLHGAHAWALHGAVDAYLVGTSADRPCYQKEPAPRIVLRLPGANPSPLPERWRVRPNEKGSLVLLPLPGFLDWSEFQWQDATDDEFRPVSLERDSTRSSPGYPAWKGLRRTGKPGCASIQIAVDLPVDQSAVVIPLLQAPLGGNSAEIVAAEGLEVVEETTRFVRVRRDVDDTPGTLWLRWCHDHPLPQEVIRGVPPVVVAEDDEGDLLMALLEKLEVVQ